MNIYSMGKLGIAEGIALVFCLVIPRLFLSGLSDLIQKNGQLLWLTMLIYTIIPLLILWMMTYVYNHTSGNFVSICYQLVGKVGGWFIVVGYIGMFFGNSALLLRQYAEYTLITALPEVDFQIVIFWYAVTVAIVCYLGIEALCRTGYIMLPLLVGGLIMVCILVSPFYIVYNLAPWQGNGIIKAIFSGITNVGLSLGVLALLFLSSAFQNNKTIKSIAIYVTSGVLILRIGFTLVYTMVFGVVVGAEKSMPFFELTRLVYLNQYIQRIEALFIIVWVIIGLLSIASFLYIALYLIVLLFQLPTIRPIVPLGVVIIGQVAMLPPDISYAIRLDHLIVYLSNIGMYVFPGMLFIMSLLKKRRRKSCSSA